MRSSSSLAFAFAFAFASFPPVLADEFTLHKGESQLGQEAATDVTSDGRSRTLTGAIDVRLTETPWKAEYRLELDAAGAPRAYRLTSATHELELTRTEAGLELTGKVMGNPVEKVFPPGEDPQFVLDNLAWSHWDVLGAAAVARVGSFALVVLIPQAAVAIPGRLTLRQDELVARRGDPGGRDAEERAAIRGELVAGKLLAQVDLDARDGRAYRIVLPGQRFEARRAGWTVTVRGVGPAAPEEGVARRELAVEVAGPRDRFGATLVLPRGEGPWPAAVLLPGAGVQDRDQSIGPNRPYRDLAHGLAARGIASLRWDKRTFRLRREVQVAESAERRKELLAEQLALGMKEEYVDDAVAALAWLRARSDVQAGALLVVGHGTGGLVAPEVAGEGRAAGIVLLAAPGRPFVELLEEQMAHQALLAGKPEAEARAEAKRTLDGLRRGLAGELLPERVVLGATVRYWQDLHARDLPALLRGCALPVLALGAEQDCQVRAVDLEALRAALAARERIPGQARLLPGRNHLFQAVDGPSTGAEYLRAAPLDPEVCEAIAAWWREVAPR